jgi:protein O-GlcNAc transferase
MGKQLKVFAFFLSSVATAVGWQQPAASSQFAAAQQKYQQSNFREALADLKLALAKDPSNPEILIPLGVAEDQFGSYRDANAHLKSAVQRLPLCAPCWMNLGVNFSHLDQPTEAALAFLQAIQIDPKLANAYFNLGQVYFNQGKLVDAARVLKKARQLAPTDFGTEAQLALTYFKANDQQALNRLLHELEISCLGDVSPQIRLATLLARVGKVEEARQKFETLRQSAANSSTVSYYEALIYYERSEFEKAEQILESMSNAAQAEPEIKGLQGMILARRGSYQKAISLLDEAVQIQPNERNMFNLAYALYYQLQFEPARKLLLRLVYEYPTSFRAHMTLGAVDQQLGKYPEAMDSYQQALIFNPRAASAYVGLGNVQMMSSAVPAAIQSFKKAIALAPTLAEAHFYYGLALRQAGSASDLSESIVHFRKAVEANTSMTLAYVELGKGLIKQGKAHEGEEYLLTALELDPDSPQAHYVLGQYYRHRGDLSRAQTQLQRFEQLRDKRNQAEIKLQQSLLAASLDGSKNQD